MTPIIEVPRGGQYLPKRLNPTYIVSVELHDSDSDLFSIQLFTEGYYWTVIQKDYNGKLQNSIGKKVSVKYRKNSTTN